MVLRPIAQQPPSWAEPALGPQLSQDAGKKTLVLDLGGCCGCHSRTNCALPATARSAAPDKRLRAGAKHINCVTAALHHRSVACRPPRAADETLVHSSFKPVPQPDYIIPVEIEGRVVDVYVLKRPFVDHFLRAVGSRFEVGKGAGRRLQLAGGGPGQQSLPPRQEGGRPCRPCLPPAALASHQPPLFPSPPHH